MLSKKWQRNHSQKRSTISTNVSLSQVQDNFSCLNKTNFPTNKYLLKSQPVKITQHRTQSKKVYNKTNNKKSLNTEKSIISKPAINPKIENSLGMNTRSQTPMITRSKSNRKSNWRKKYNI